MHNEPSVLWLHLCTSTSKPLQPPTVEPTKEKAAIKMDDFIDSNGEVSTTKKKSNSDADNVPVSMSEEEEARMES
jgi:hypothetical protein